MATWRRFRAFFGPWLLIGLLVATLLGITVVVDALRHHLDDRALRESVASASYLDRDLLVTRTTRTGLVEPPDAQEQYADVLAALPATLDDVMSESWVYQHTEISQLEGFGASLVGEGVTSEPAGFAPVISLHTQSGFDAETRLIDGRSPDTASSDVLEVMVEERIAEDLGVEVDSEYELQAGRIGISPDVVDPSRALPIRVVGTYAPLDARSAAWDHAPLLVESQLTAIIQEQAGDQPRAVRAGLLTDAEGIRLLSREAMTTHFAPETVVRLRLDPQRLDAEWAVEAEEAIARLSVDPSLFDTRLRTGLVDLIDRFSRRSEAAQALVDLLVAATLGAGLGALLAASGLLIERRRHEIGLVRARGARLSRIAGRMALEATPVVLLAVVAGWAMHRPVLDQLATRRSGLGDIPAVVSTSPLLAGTGIALVGLLTIPLAAVTVARRQSPERARGVARHRPTLPRLTLEVATVSFAVLGVVVLRQRGLTGAGADAYLAAVPLLVAVAAGMLVLRAYPWPLRALEPLGRRRRGAVGFLALARAGRSAASSTWTLLVLVVAAALTGFSGAMLRAMATRAGADGALEETAAFHDGLLLLFGGGVVTGMTTGLLAAALLVVMPAAGRASELQLLRDLGLPRGQARALLLLEVLPPVVVAAAGLAIGMATPALLGPALGLQPLLGVATPAVGISPAIVVTFVILLVGPMSVGVVTTASPRPARLDAARP